jgi:hypothetical protein
MCSTCNGTGIMQLFDAKHVKTGQVLTPKHGPCLECGGKVVKLRTVTGNQPLDYAVSLGSVKAKGHYYQVPLIIIVALLTVLPQPARASEVADDDPIYLLAEKRINRCLDAVPDGTPAERDPHEKKCWTRWTDLFEKHGDYGTVMLAREEDPHVSADLVRAFLDRKACVTALCANR